MQSRKSPKPNDQAKAFRKAARDLGADKSEKKFNAALKAVARHKPVDDPNKDFGRKKKPT
jgi:hypothetical protein